MAFLHDEESDHNTTDERRRGQIFIGTSKANLTGEFVIVAKFGRHALRYLASRLANVIRQGGRLKT